MRLEAGDERDEQGRAKPVNDLDPQAGPTAAGQCDEWQEGNQRHMFPLPEAGGRQQHEDPIGKCPDPFATLLEDFRCRHPACGKPDAARARDQDRGVEPAFRAAAKGLLGQDEGHVEPDGGRRIGLQHVDIEP